MANKESKPNDCSHSHMKSFLVATGSHGIHKLEVLADCTEDLSQDLTKVHSPQKDGAMPQVRLHCHHWQGQAGKSERDSPPPGSPGTDHGKSAGQLSLLC